MTVVFDLLGIQSRYHSERGIARYVLNLALGLERTHPRLVTHYLIHPERPFPDRAGPLLATGRVVRSDSGDPALKPGAGGVFLAGSMFEDMLDPLDLVLPVWARAPSWRTMAVLYDLIPARYPEVYLTDPELAHRYRARAQAIASCDHLLAISQATADDAVELLDVPPKSVTMIGAGADQRRFRPPTENPAAVARSLARSGAVADLRSDYLLFPTGIEWRKNVERTLEAYGRLPAEVRADHQLVLVASLDEHGRRVVDDLAARFDLGDDLLATGFVSDETLTQLYQGAGAVIFPSLYEGFGLPALEAMQCGAAVLCADSSSLKEVQPLAEARFDPLSVASMGATIERILTDSEFREHVRAQPLPPFTWDLAAELTGEAIIGVQAALTPPRTRRPRLGLFTPLPPQRSGIATYAYRLLEHLRHHCEVTVFVDNTTEDIVVDTVLAPEGVMIEPIDRLESILAGGGAFDELLYFMGNSTFHVEMLEVLRRHGGVVLAHDVRLTGLYSETQRLTPDRLVGHSVGATLRHLYPFRYPPTIEAETVILPDAAERFGILAAREVATRASRVLVHSRHAASLLHLDAGVEAEVVYPIPSPAGHDGDARAMPAGPPTIASFGIVDPCKDPEALIGALALALDHLPDAVLELVGDIHPDYQEQLMGLVAALGVDHAVRFLGHLDDAGFRAAQERATVAVQLRAVSNGESSAAVSELLALGIPTVVSELGSMAEYPAGVVATVPPAVEPHRLAEVLTGLLTDPAATERLSIAATDYARANGFERAAETLAKTLFS